MNYPIYKASFKSMQDHRFQRSVATVCKTTGFKDQWQPQQQKQKKLHSTGRVKDAEQNRTCGWRDSHKEHGLKSVLFSLTTSEAVHSSGRVKDAANDSGSRPSQHLRVEG